MNTNPHIGLIVLYYQQVGTAGYIIPRPAIITWVNNDCTVDMEVFGNAAHPSREFKFSISECSLPRKDKWMLIPKENNYNTEVIPLVHNIPNNYHGGK